MKPSISKFGLGILSISESFRTPKRVKRESRVKSQESREYFFFLAKYRLTKDEFFQVNFYNRADFVTCGHNLLNKPFTFRDC